jgi:hypothetical protein
MPSKPLVAFSYEEGEIWHMSAPTSAEGCKPKVTKITFYGLDDQWEHSSSVSHGGVVELRKRGKKILERFMSSNDFFLFYCFL